MTREAGRAIGILIVLGLAAASMMMCRTKETSDTKTRVEALLAGLGSEQEPGAAILVVQDGRIVLESCRGISDLKTLRPIDRRTNFRLASLSKAFTAAAVMLLVHDRKLRYEDRLTDIFPDFPTYGRDVTVRRILDHTSGLPDYEDLMPPVDPSVPVEDVQIKDAEVLELLKQETSGRFLPGAKWAYSNSGYVVLGLIVEKASGRPFPEFLRDRIFVPLGMTGTVAFVRGINDVAERAFGHSMENGRLIETDQSPTSATLGDGGIYSSLADMAKWDEALRRHTLLSEAEMEPALTPVRVPGGPPTGPDGEAAEYGFGWFLDPWRSHARMWHYGETTGFRTAIQRFVDDGLTVIVLCNRSDADAIGLSLKIAGLYLKEKG